MANSNTEYGVHSNYGTAGLSGSQTPSQNYYQRQNTVSQNLNSASSANSIGRSVTDTNNMRMQRANTISENRLANGGDSDGTAHGGSKKVSKSFLKAAKNPALYALLNWTDAAGKPVHMIGVYLKNVHTFLNDPYSDDVGAILGK